MGRKNSKQVIVEMTPEEKSRLEAYAKAEDLRMAQVIRKLIRELPEVEKSA